MAEAPDSEEKALDAGFLQRFGLTEILGHLFPGAIALTSLLIWGVPQPETILGPELATNNLVLGVMTLILAYAGGLIISMWSLAGAEAYRARSRPPSPLGVIDSLRFLRQWLAWRWLRLTVGLRDWKSPQASFNAYLDIATLLNRVYGTASMPLMRELGDQLVVFRALAQDRLKNKVSAVVTEAETLHRRVMFALGAAFSFLLFALSALLRLAVTGVLSLWPGILHWTPPDRSAVLLTAIFAVALYGSFKLRTVAAENWDRELVMTLAIARLHA